MRAPFPFDPEDPIHRQAGDWLARRDRGFTPAEQDAFLEWQAQDARHREAVVRLTRAWQVLDRLNRWQPEHSQEPNPDLLVTRPRRRARPLALAALAAVVALVGIGVTRQFRETPRAPAASPALTTVAPGASLRVIPPPPSVTLPDGSTLQLSRDARYALAFTARERQLRLLAGELHVDIVRDPARPFVVMAGGVAIRAVGTAFHVRSSAGSVDVLVTEGQVEVQTSGSAAEGANASEPLAMGAGEQARVELAQASIHRATRRLLTAAEIDRELGWRAGRLEFDALPLADAVAEFNRRNPLQLEIADPRLASLRVAGSFRADEAEAFARLLEISFGVTVERPPVGPWRLHQSE